MAQFFLDNRGLQPPEPMMRTLDKLETMAAGDVLTIHNDKKPLLLLDELLQRADYRVEIHEQPDGSFQVVIEKGI